MTSGFRLVGAVVLAAATLGSAHALAASPRLLVFYIEAAPAKAASVADQLDKYASKIRDDEGPDAPVMEVLRESGRPGRMAIVEQWRNLSPDKAEKQAKALQAQIGADLQAPVDDRLGDPLTPLDLTTAPTGVFHVLMHIDVVPEGAAIAAKTITAQKTSVMAAAGALAFEAAAQTGRTNHFEVHEVWKDRAAYEAYVASPAGEDLRRQFTAYKGAPFDDRFYGH